MAYFKTRRQARYNLLRSEHFAPLEARELSRLPKGTPAMRALRKQRVEKWERFQKWATHKELTPQERVQKWSESLSSQYSQKRYRVQEGPTGKQPPMQKGTPNPWAMYRDFIAKSPDKKFKSPWEKKHYGSRGKGGKKSRKKGGPLDTGQLFIQKAHKASSTGALKDAQTREWIRQLDANIAKATGTRRTNLVMQRERLRESLE